MTKNIHIKIPEELHHALRQIALNRKITLKALILEVLLISSRKV